MIHITVGLYNSVSSKYFGFYINWCRPAIPSTNTWAGFANFATLMYHETLYYGYLFPLVCHLFTFCRIFCKGANWLVRLISHHFSLISVGMLYLDLSINHDDINQDKTLPVVIEDIWYIYDKCSLGDVSTVHEILHKSTSAVSRRSNCLNNVIIIITLGGFMDRRN